jgi:hypothetical protein
MIACTTASDAQQASLLVLELDAHGIDAVTSHDGGSVAFGDLPASVLHVQILVPEAQLEEARRVVAEFVRRGQRKDDEHRAPWTCVSCSESNEPTFELCWNCQAAAPGASIET